MVTESLESVHGEGSGDNDHDHEDEFPFCAAMSKVTGDFVDLSLLSKAAGGPDQQDWIIRGHDFGANFSVNICNPIVDSPSEQYVGVEDADAVGAYYIDKESGSAWSLGQANHRPYFRGRNLILQYENGSPCLDEKGYETAYRMSSVFSFKCDRDLLLSSPPSKAAVLTYAASTNKCSFFFEVRTVHACPSVDKTQGMNPIIIFCLFILVAVMVYSSSSVLRLPSILVAKLLGRRPLMSQRTSSAFDFLRNKNGDDNEVC